MTEGRLKKYYQESVLLEQILLLMEKAKFQIFLIHWTNQLKLLSLLEWVSVKELKKE